MTQNYITDRYTSRENAEQLIEDGVTVHAALGGPGVSTLCEARTVPTDLVLDLTHDLTTPQWRATVSCPGCLEWMHA